MRFFVILKNVKMSKTIKYGCWLTGLNGKTTLLGITMGNEACCVQRTLKIKKKRKEKIPLNTEKSITYTTP